MLNNICDTYSSFDFCFLSTFYFLIFMRNISSPHFCSVSCSLSSHSLPSFKLQTCNSIRGFVGLLVHSSVTIKLESVKTRISAPAHPSTTGGCVSGLVIDSFWFAELILKIFFIFLDILIYLYFHHHEDISFSLFKKNTYLYPSDNHDSYLLWSNGLAVNMRWRMPLVHTNSRC